MMRYPTILILTLCGVLSAGASLASESPRPKTIPTPLVHLTWDAPWGDPKAKKDLVTACSDTTRSHSLFLSFEAPASVMALIGISGTLLFEPEAGDTLGAFWQFEREGSNAGSLGIDFDKVYTATCSVPWKAIVYGSVGYTHGAGRGRLDLSADVGAPDALNLYPKLCYVWARITVKEQRAKLDGCVRPMRITWVGGRFRSSRLHGGQAEFGVGPDQSVTWNAHRGGVALRRTGLAIETWVPVTAPQSRAALRNFTPLGTPLPRRTSSE